MILSMSAKRITPCLFIMLSVLTAVLFCVDLSVGAVSIPVADVWAALTGGDCPDATAFIVRNIRLIKAVVALLTGAAWVGAAAVLIVIASVGHRIKDIMVILILGMMFSSGVGAVVQILQYLSEEESLKAFVIWTMGSLGDVTGTQLAVLAPAVVVGLILAVATIKPLNLLLFGEEYAVTMGLNLRRSRLLLFLSTTLLAGTVTAFCGPIGFIGLAMPHVARMLMRDSDHRVLIPATALAGGAVLLLCDIISKLFTLPINAITALLGIPVVVWVVLRNK